MHSELLQRGSASWSKRKRIIQAQAFQGITMRHTKGVNVFLFLYRRHQWLYCSKPSLVVVENSDLLWIHLCISFLAHTKIHFAHTNNTALFFLQKNPIPKFTLHTRLPPSHFFANQQTWTSKLPQWQKFFSRVHVTGYLEPILPEPKKWTP